MFERPYSDGTAIILTKEKLFKLLHFDPKKDNFIIWNKIKGTLTPIENFDDLNPDDNKLIMKGDEGKYKYIKDKVEIFRIDTSKMYKSLNWNPMAKWRLSHPIKTRRFFGRSKKIATLVYQEGQPMPRTNVQAYAEADYKKADQFTIRTEAKYQGYSEWMKSLKRGMGFPTSRKWIIIIMILIIFGILFYLYNAGMLPFGPPGRF